eukprot:g28939.t1
MTGSIGVIGLAGAASGRRQLSEVPLATHSQRFLRYSKARCWDLALLALAARVARAATEAPEVLEQEEGEAEEAEIEEDCTSLRVSMPALEFDPERAEGIVAAVKEAKKQQLGALDLLRERNLITDEASTVQAFRALRLAGLHEEVRCLA